MPAIAALVLINRHGSGLFLLPGYLLSYRINAIGRKTLQIVGVLPPRRDLHALATLLGYSVLPELPAAAIKVRARGDATQKCRPYCPFTVHDHRARAGCTKTGKTVQKSEEALVTPR